MRWLIPRFDWGSWSGPAIGYESTMDVEVTGFFVAIGWLGLHAELCLAREGRAHPHHPGDLT
jgi:hypothetical protein